MESATVILDKAIKFGARHTLGFAVISISAMLGILSASLGTNVAVSTLNSLEDWALPQVSNATLVTDIDTMLAEPLFGGQPIIKEETVAVDMDPDATGQEGDLWRLIGIITEGNTKHVVIFNDTAGKIETAELGETLPGGEELIIIRNNDIEILHNEERRQLSLFVDTSAEELER